MILVGKAKEICNQIIEMYKNKELALYVWNDDDNVIDLAVYDDFRKDKDIGRYLASNNLKYTSISKPNFKLSEFTKIKRELKKYGINEKQLYEYKLNETIYKIGDVIEYEKYKYGKIIDIDSKSNFPYAVVFPDIYLDDRPFWIADDEIKLSTSQDTINLIDSWYYSNKMQIDNDIKNLNEMECDI